MQPRTQAGKLARNLTRRLCREASAQICLIQGVPESILRVALELFKIEIETSVCALAETIFYEEVSDYDRKHEPH